MKVFDALGVKSKVSYLTISVSLYIYVINYVGLCMNMMVGLCITSLCLCAHDIHEHPS